MGVVIASAPALFMKLLAVDSTTASPVDNEVIDLFKVISPSAFKVSEFEAAQFSLSFTVMLPLVPGCVVERVTLLFSNALLSVTPLR